MPKRVEVGTQTRRTRWTVVWARKKGSARVVQATIHVQSAPGRFRGALGRLFDSARAVGRSGTFLVATQSLGVRGQASWAPSKRGGSGKRARRVAQTRPTLNSFAVFDLRGRLSFHIIETDCHLTVHDFEDAYRSPRHCQQVRNVI